MAFIMLGRPTQIEGSEQLIYEAEKFNTNYENPKFSNIQETSYPAGENLSNL